MAWNGQIGPPTHGMRIDWPRQNWSVLECDRWKVKWLLVHRMLECTGWRRWSNRRLDGTENSLMCKNPKKVRVKVAASIRRSCRQSQREHVMAVRRSASTEDVMGLRGADVGAVCAHRIPCLASCRMGLWRVGSLRPTWRCREAMADK